MKGPAFPSDREFGRMVDPEAPPGRRQAQGRTVAQVNKLLDQADRKIQRTVELYFRDRLNASGLRAELKRQIYDLYDKLYRLGIEASGVSRNRARQAMGPSDRRLLKQTLRQELGFLNNLIGDITRGRISMTQAKKRASNYIGTARSVYQTSFVTRVRPDSIFHWIKEPKGACKECEFLARNSPYTRDTLPTVPKAGHTRCRNNCRCRIKVVAASRARVDGINRRQSRARLQRQLAASMRRGSGKTTGRRVSRRR